MQQRPQPPRPEQPRANRERIVRPSAADQAYDTKRRQTQASEQEPEQELNDDDFEELSQDDLLEWLTQKVIKLELAEERRTKTTPPQVGKQTPQQPSALQAKKQEKKQPYETNYTTEPPTEKPKQKQSLGRLIGLFIGLILIGIILWNLAGILFFGYQLPF
jgi:hypothetical protein